LKADDIRGQMNRIESALRQLCTQVSEEVGRRINRLHNYMIKFWMVRVGPEALSVYGAPHKTNNVLER